MKVGEDTSQQYQVREEGDREWIPFDFAGYMQESLKNKEMLKKEQLEIDQKYFCMSFQVYNLLKVMVDKFNSQ